MPTPSETKPLLYTEFPPLHDDEAVAPQEGTVVTSYLGLMSTMAGACILTLPSTMQMTPVLPSSVLLVTFALLAYAGCVCICIACDGSGATSFESLAKRLRHPFQLWIVRGLVMMLLFGAVVMYVVIATDMLQPFLPFLSRFVLGGLFAGICLPLCLPDTVAALKYTNSVVVCCVLYIVVVLLLQAVSQENPWPAEPVSPITFRGVAYTVPIQALSYCMHLNIPQVYSELQHKPSMTKVFALLFGSGVALYLTAALAGYACFHGFPPADILTGFAADNPTINGVRIALGLCMICKTPITYQPLRDVMEDMADGMFPKMPFRIAATSSFLIATWVLAVTANDLGYVMDWVGATAGILLSFGFPGLFLWEMLEQDYHQQEYTPTQIRWYKVLAAFMIFTGVSLSTISIIKMVWFY
ncbi:hypothetical protein H310_12461 [Aphanomyces invadans]|uniref:Amino acid transporter transmembrane domain-containing protein n=1 Tax=Aphanomyces invadans TaxID=157072 RepID=A0A024THQ4_9STRA|nr:hypothetical protein H310_12461 [Aphanomyces invadans]ETV93695.1 hypothetical protein H310_12461 [Aphanomyces invadans]|eukprot:XP_008877736.1 hypothetical protein H310_12461 [Aphanomyces invadans]